MNKGLLLLALRGCFFVLFFIFYFISSQDELVYVLNVRLYLINVLFFTGFTFRTSEETTYVKLSSASCY